MGEYPGFPPDRHQVDEECHGMQSRHDRMVRFEAMNVKLLIAVVLPLLILLGILIATVLGVRIDVILENVR